MSKRHENGPRADHLADTDLEEVSGGLGNFHIQDLRKTGIVAPEGKPEGTASPTPESGKGLVFENVTYKY